MRRVCCFLIVAGVLVAAMPAAALAGGRSASAARGAGRGRLAKPRSTSTSTSTSTSEVPVSFRVVDANTSPVPCTADGKTYTIAGDLFLPAGPVPSGVTLYAHGLGYAGYFWDFTAVPGYDYAATEAGDGHASVVIDRLGYGASSIPAGSATCVGSQASILHQIIGQLRAGSYHFGAAGSATAPAFSRIGLVGHSAGGELAEIEAYSFHDINALGIVEWADQGYSTGAYEAFASDAVQCVTGGSDQVGSTSAGYAAFGETTAEYDALMFADIDPAVEAAANRLRTLDPCGQIESILTGVAIDATRIGGITVPIAYVHAGDDGIFEDVLPWSQTQELLYTGTSKLTDITIPGAGHAVTLERTAPQFEQAMNAWLSANHL